MCVEEEIERGDEVRDVCWDGLHTGRVTAVDGDTLTVRWYGHLAEDQIHRDQVTLLRKATDHWITAQPAP